MHFLSCRNQGHFLYISVGSAIFYVDGSLMFTHNALHAGLVLDGVGGHYWQTD